MKRIQPRHAARPRKSRLYISVSLRKRKPSETHCVPNAKRNEPHGERAWVDEEWTRRAGDGDGVVEVGGGKGRSLWVGARKWEDEEAVEGTGAWKGGV